MKSRTTVLKVPAVVKPQTDKTAATPSLTTFAELMQALDVVDGQSQMPEVISPQGSSQARLHSEKPEEGNYIVPQMPNAVPDWPLMKIAKPVLPVSFYTCI
jgi:hypothetical protein